MIALSHFLFKCLAKDLSKIATEGIRSIFNSHAYCGKIYVCRLDMKIKFYLGLGLLKLTAAFKLFIDLELFKLPCHISISVINLEGSFDIYQMKHEGKWIFFHLLFSYLPFVMVVHFKLTLANLLLTDHCSCFNCFSSFPLKMVLIHCMSDS